MFFLRNNHQGYVGFQPQETVACGGASRVWRTAGISNLTQSGRNGHTKSQALVQSTKFTKVQPRNIGFK